MPVSRVKDNGLTRYTFSSLPLVLFLVTLVITQTYSYLLFHTTVEMFSVAIAVAIFLFAWNTRKISRNNYFLFLGIAYLFLAIIDFLHTLAYKGMNIFTGFDANLPTQLWISQRYLLAFSLLLAPIFMKKKLRELGAFLVFAAITAALLFSIFYFRNFPVSYQEGTGLTSFKVYSEYFISFIFLVSTIILILVREKFDRQVFLLLAFFFIFNVITELFFTLYVGVYDVFNMLGHLFELLAFYLVYKAIIEVGLTKPYNLLFLELKRLNEKKDEFLSLVSHEIKNPLTTIKLSSDLLGRRLNETQDEESLNCILQINSEADKINRHINDLLDISRIETGRLKFNMDNLDLNDLTEEAVESCRVLSIKHNILLQKPGENVQLKGDRVRLGQVLINLITNAVKYSPTGTKVIVKIKKDKDIVKISVQDFGIGIAKNQLPLVFDKYYRTRGAQKSGLGLGLGLYIAKAIVQAHRGRIWVESKKNQGSTFYLTLPLKN